MAMIHCPECGHLVSDRAASCVHCGYPFKEEGRMLEAIAEMMETITIFVMAMILSILLWYIKSKGYGVE